MSALQLEAELAARPDPEGEAAAECTPRQETFARHLVECGNASAAYRAAYDVQSWHSRAWIAQNAWRTRSLPQVASRIEHLQTELALRSVTTREGIIRWLATQVMTDANELVSLIRYACRNCHGEGFEHQWINEDEYTEAYIATLDANNAMPDGKRKLKMPNDKGGFGWSKNLEPNPICPHCLGNGNAESIIKDTTKLTGGALALYAGVKETAAGTVLVMHDKTKLVDQLCSMMGWKKDTLGPGVQPPGSQAPVAMPANISEADAAKCYLRLVGGVS